MRINGLQGLGIGISVGMMIAQTPTPAMAAFFQGLGSLPGGNAPFNAISYAGNISTDGKVVVGSSDSANGLHAYRWTKETGMVDLGYLPGSFENFSSADAVSADGSTVFGESNNQVFRWTNETGMVPVGISGRVQSVSADGSVIVGQNYDNLANEAYRWTSETGVVGLGKIPGTFFSTSNDVSADGSVIVGQSSWAIQWHSFLWTSETGMIDLGYLPGGADDPTPFSLADGVSADGKVVVGISDSFNGIEAYRWTSETGMLGLGDLAGGSFFSSATDVSADGSVIVGSGTGINGNEAFIWDSVNGMRSLQEVLTNDYGLDLTGWNLGTAWAVSADGLTITGNGTNPDGQTEAWVANLSPSQTTPEPTTLLGLLAFGTLGIVASKKEKN